MTEETKASSFLERKDIEISFQRYAIDALSAMAQGLFASLLIGTIFNTIGNLSGITVFNDIGAFATAVAGPAMAIAIGHALKSPPLVLYSLAVVGYAANSAGGAGGPLAVLVVAIIAAELGKAVSKETKVDILVTPAVTVGLGCLLAMFAGPGIGAVATAIGSFIMWATELQPFLMGILVSVVVGIALTLPISSAAICAALGLTGLAGGATTAGAASCRRASAPRCFKWATSCANRSSGFRRLSRRLSQGPSPPVCSACNKTAQPSHRAWVPAGLLAPSAYTAVGLPMASRQAHSSGWAWRSYAWCFPQS